MFTDEQLEQLEEKEHEHAIEEYALLLAILASLSVDLGKELSSFYQKYGTDGIVTYYQARRKVSEKDKRKRYIALFLAINKLFEQTFENFDSNFKSHLKYIVGEEFDFFEQEVDIDDILSTPWGEDNLTWRERLWAYKKKWVNVICSDLKQSFHRRDELEDVLEDLGYRFSSMEKILWKLLVSESTATNSIARQKIFKEMGVSKYRFYTRVDERRCEQCGSLHGLVFPMSAWEVGVTASPIHPHCRCWEVPIIE